MPGPQNYDPKLAPKKNIPLWSQPKERRFANNVKDKQKPGPGYYDHNSYTVEGPKFSVRPKPALRSSLGFRSCVEGPGPAEYDPLKSINSLD